MPHLHPLSALQSEYSLWSRDVEPEILPTLRELGIGLVPYSPLGRGMLAGWSKDWKADGFDFRAAMAPRFKGEALEHNLALVEEIAAIASGGGGSSMRAAGSCARLPAATWWPVSPTA